MPFFSCNCFGVGVHFLHEHFKPSLAELVARRITVRRECCAFKTAPGNRRGFLLVFRRFIFI